MFSRYILFPLFLFCNSLGGAVAQDLDNLKQVKPITISGGLSANQIIYFSNQATTYRAPYNYYLGGQINLNIYGLSLPFSFTYSNQKTQFRQPFNQFSVHPTYKWINAHIGYTAQSYSPYTVNGHLFEGGAIELSPGDNWQIGFMAGRLQRAIGPDSTSNIIPAFERFGFAVSLKYGSESDFAKLTLFKSKDDPSSIQFQEAISPEDNLVGSLEFSKRIINKIAISGEYARSVLTRDIRSQEKNNSSNYLGLFTPRVSTEYYDAYNASLMYQEKLYTVGVRYENVGADYRTHGAYFFNNNFSNISLTSSVSLMGGRLKFITNLGIQEDNPKNSKMSSTKRLVGSFSSGIKASQKLNLNLSYSNYTTFTNINKDYLDLSFLSPYDRIDTLNYAQVAQNASASANYVLNQSKERTQFLMSAITVMETRDIQGTIEQNTSSLFITFNSTYTYTITPVGLSMSGMINIQKDLGEVTTTIIGPTISASKLLFNKAVHTSVAIAYNKVLSIGQSGTTLNTRLSAGYRIGESHNLQISMISVSRSNTGEIQSSVTDFTGTLGYSYNF